MIIKHLGVRLAKTAPDNEIEVHEKSGHFDSWETNIREKFVL